MLMLISIIVLGIVTTVAVSWDKVQDILVADYVRQVKSTFAP